MAEPAAPSAGRTLKHELCVEVNVNAVQIHGTPDALRAFADIILGVTKKQGNKAQGCAAQLSQEDETGDLLHPSSIGKVYIRAHQEFRLSTPLDEQECP